LIFLGNAGNLVSKYVLAAAAGSASAIVAVVLILEKIINFDASGK
jgi:hypothetical protein